MTVSAAPEEVFLVFRPRAASAGLRWWQRLFTDRHRAHVVALLPLGPERALALDHAGSVLSVELVEMPAEQAARGLMWSWDGEALRVQPRAVARRAALRPPMTCVEVAKALLGVHDWRVLTPRHLRRAAIGLGARPVAPYAPVLAGG